MKIEIDVDLGPYAEEWEAVAFRKPLKGECFITDAGHPHVWGDQQHTNPRLIIQRKWKWPEWLKAEWIVKFAIGGWVATNEEPLLTAGDYWSWGRYAPIYLDVFDFTPPPCTDWRQSKRRNPNLPPKEKP